MSIVIDLESQFRNKLLDATDRMFAMMKATVDGDTPILVESWIDKVDNQICGCLMMDGFAEKHPWRAEVLYAAMSEDYSSDSERKVMRALAHLYEIDDDTFTRLSLAVVFDNWARVNEGYVSNDRGTLSEHGRTALRGIFEDVSFLRRNEEPVGA